MTACPEGEGDSGINFKCEACKAENKCKTCTANSTTCESCNIDSVEKYISVDGICLEACPDGESFESATAAALRCELCEPANKCKTCTAAATRCDTCFTDAAEKFLSVAGTCLTACSDGEGDSGTDYTCETCKAENNCKTCVANSTACESCDTTSAEKYLSTGAVCLPACPDGERDTGAGSVCELCHPAKRCKTCTKSPSRCDTCDRTSPEKYLSAAGKCVDACSLGERAIDGDICLNDPMMDDMGNLPCREGYYMYTTEVDNRVVARGCILCPFGYYTAWPH